MTINENIQLKNFTTFKIGGPARYFVYAKTDEDIKEALAWAQEKSIPIFIFGGGSNIVISNNGFNGLVIKIETKGIEYSEEGNTIHAKVAAGEVWDAFVEDTVKRGFYGVENLTLIPGTVGASPIQNIGAYGMEAREVIKEVEAVHIKTFERKVFSNEECQFTYRNSFFKSEEGRKWIVLNVTFSLSKQGVLNTSYPDVIRYFTEKNVDTPKLEDLRDAIIEIRTKKLPDLEKYGTAGSFFKNPIVSDEKCAELKEKYPEIQVYKVEGGYKVSFAWVLDHIFNLKGKVFGNVGLYERQPLALVNKGGATSEEVKNVAKMIMSKTKEELGVDVEPEVQFVG